MAATPKLIQFASSPQQHPASQAITQVELGLLLSLRARVAQLQSEIDRHEQSFQIRLESGSGVEPGAHTATIQENFRRNVSWKAVCRRLADRLKLNGEAYTRRVLASTKPTRTVSLDIR